MFYESKLTSFWPRHLQPKTGFVSVPSSSRLLPFEKRGKTERQQKAELREKFYNAPIFTIRVLGAILNLTLFARNFMFGAKANISNGKKNSAPPTSRAEIRAHPQ